MTIPQFLLCHMLLSTLYYVPQAISVSFDFDFSQPSSWYQAAKLSLQGDARMEDKVIELTRKGSENSVGRASYSEAVAIWDEITGELTSFTTVFSFQILPDTYFSTGDGMAFFLGHYPSIIPASGVGGSLGLFSTDTTNATGDNRAVAVEFDTHDNPAYDNSNNHIGIDVNSLISREYANTSNVPGRNLTSGLVMTCRISYENSTQRLAADLQIGNVTYHVDSIIDLRKVLPSVVAIGFSAATGVSSELHRLLAWSFNSTLDGPRAPAPNSTLDGPRAPAPNSKIRVWKIVVIITGAADVVVVIAGFVYLRRRLRRQNNTGYETPAHVARCFSYHELAEATHNFAEEQKLGEGAYACVYRGELANPSRSVAVKRFKRGTSSSIGMMRAFEDEVEAISQVRHRNLVELVGWCNDGKKHRLLLVYELVTEGNLDEHLHGGRSWLSWTMRYKIILNLGRALQYLHEDCSFCVLHGDIKSSNILLDSRHVAKLGDFGLARFTEHEIELKNTCNIAGTPGYVDPDFVTTGKRSRVSDVYSFGIVLLEIVSGRRPAVVDHQTMVTPLLLWVWGKNNGEAILEAADAALREESTAVDRGQMERALLVGLWCAHPDPTQRPSIAEALRALQSRDVEIPHLPLPVFMAGLSNFATDDRPSASETSDGASVWGELQWTR
ncbi:hypothetical protein SETIT_3G358600v2 [Setaria italica]|uniref:non-specific serine/threonine protein kinase n=2 Tax=Setaria italica TaxID=4555 RepID=A0A368QMJ0_SETIT|nr:L-type lectin-domain containing receptor kinase IX.1 [Setaria italica]RCV19123.1 hypothetical protein SETIT_3G358600v2 [Setaria italica]